jgi:hypothetical protein
MAGMQIASLFASIGADTSGLDRGLQSAKKGITGLANDIKKSPKIDMAMMVTGLNQAVQLFDQAKQAVGQMYDAVKEGAAMDFAVEKFDRLAESIGTTSTVLMQDLRNATRNTVSDMDLVAMSSNIMSLGLMKNHEDVVRLSKVAGGLGMDMNQLVLTLANKTTMRFDQLGVAVAGFEDKVKALEDAGMSADDAFSEAFLQQAETQLAKVGEIADSTAGSFMVLETSWKNFSDNFLMSVSNDLSPAVEETSNMFSVWSERFADNSAFDELTKNLESVGVDVESFKKRFGDTKNFAGWITDIAGYNQLLEDMSTAYEQTTASNDYYTKLAIINQESYTSSMDAWAQKQWEATEAGQKWVEQQAQIAEANKQSAAATDEWASSNYDLGVSFEDMAGQSITATGAVNSTSLADARGEIDATKGVVGDLALAYRDLELAQLGFQGQIAGMVFDDLTTKYKSGVISLKQYKDGLVDLDAAMGTDFSMELELKEKIPELTRTLLEDPDSFKDNIITVSSDFGELDENVKESTKLVEMLELKLMAIARTWNANVNINVNGNKLPTGTGGYQSVPEGADTGGNFNPRYPAVGGPVYTNSPYIVGERGPELFVPSGSGYILTNAQTANTLDGGGGGNLSEIVSRIPTARDIAVAVRDALLLAG